MSLLADLGCSNLCRGCSASLACLGSLQNRMRLPHIHTETLIPTIPIPSRLDTTLPTGLSKDDLHRQKDISLRNIPLRTLYLALI